MHGASSVTIIGGGIIGCSIALELSTNGYTDVTVIEKNKSIPGLNQSSTNEGSIHSGVYYPKDLFPLKAELCVKGNILMYKFLEKYKLPFKRVGKLIIATNSHEEEYLDFFLQIGLENGVSGIRKISGSEATQMEPNISNVIAALYVPSAGCASPVALIKKIRELAEENGVTFMLGTQVKKIIPYKKSFRLLMTSENNQQAIKTDFLINSAGLYSDEIAKMINSRSPYKIEATRGEFCQFDKNLRENIWTNDMHIYQPPYCYTTENGHFKTITFPASQLRNKLKERNVVITAGVHISPAFEETNGEFVMSKTTISPLKTIGLGKENYSTNLHSTEDYIQKVNYFYPNLKVEDINLNHTGIMCPLKPQGDFVIEKDKKYPNCINLIGMESPAWSASFAIAKYVQKLME